MGDFMEAQVGAERPGSATVRRSAMLEVRGSTDCTFDVYMTTEQPRLVLHNQEIFHVIMRGVTLFGVYYEIMEKLDY